MSTELEKAAEEFAAACAEREEAAAKKRAAREALAAAERAEQEAHEKVGRASVRLGDEALKKLPRPPSGARP